MSLLGIDIGTSSCKAATFDSNGRILTTATRSYQATYTEIGKVEIAPELLWQAIASAITTVAHEVSEPVTALAISSHGETLIPVDRQGVSIGPAILNVDSRATTEAEACERQFGRKEIFQLTGQIVNPSYPLVKLAWLRQHQPESYRAAHQFLGPSEFALLNMGVPTYTDDSLASRFLAYNVTTRRWSHELLDFAGLSYERLPTVVPAGTIVGEIDRTMAGELGLSPGTLVAVGGHDQACGALGVGAVTPGLVSDSIGSYECVAHVDNKPRLDEDAFKAKLNTYCHVVPDSYITIVYYPAGIMLKWFIDLLTGTPEEDNNLYTMLEAQAPAGPTGLLVLPHLIGSSTPHFDSRATGAIVGLTPACDRARLYKGVLEGMACELNVITEVLAAVVGQFDTIRATGGGTRSRLGMQLRADISGRRFQVLESPESVCLGAALLAGIASGVYTSVSDAVARAVRVQNTIEPNPQVMDVYTKQVRQYRRLYPVLAAIRET